MIEEVRALVAAKLADLDGIVGLQKTQEGTAPYLFRSGSDLSQLALSPRYPLAPVVSLLQKRYPEARVGVVARGCDVRALVERVLSADCLDDATPTALHRHAHAVAADEPASLVGDRIGGHANVECLVYCSGEVVDLAPQ